MVRHVYGAGVVEPAGHVANLDKGVMACGELWVGGEAICIGIFFFYGLADEVYPIVQTFAEFYFFPFPFLRGFFCGFFEESLP